jgi:hypothetical protein
MSDAKLSELEIHDPVHEVRRSAVALYLELDAGIAAHNQKLVEAAITALERERDEAVALLRYWDAGMEGSTLHGLVRKETGAFLAKHDKEKPDAAD